MVMRQVLQLIFGSRQRMFVALLISIALTTVHIIRNRETVTYKRKFVALGDSLTAGLYDNTKLHPYTNHLSRLFSRNDTFKDIELVNAGISGERVKKIKERLVVILQTLPKVQLVIILAGTNDYKDLVRGRNIPENASNVFYEKRATAIFQEIRSLHLMCFDKKIRTVTVSIPEIQWEIQKEYSMYLKYRENINQMLQNFAEEEMHEYTSFFDLSAAVRVLSMDDLQKGFFWNDAVHFTAYGYDVVAKWLYKHIGEHAKNNKIMKDKIGKELSFKKLNFLSTQRMVE